MQSAKIYVLQNKKKSTNHILHLLLSLLTLVWVFVWITISIRNRNHNKRIDTQIEYELVRLEKTCSYCS
jgi:hypothetical protein